MIARILTIIVLLVIAVPLVTFLVINRGPVDLSLDPFGTMQQFVYSVPLSLLMIVSGLVGVVLGCLFTWMSQSSHRRSSWRRKFEIERLEQEKREQADALKRLREERAQRASEQREDSAATVGYEGKQAAVAGSSGAPRMIGADNKAA